MREGRLQARLRGAALDRSQAGPRTGRIRAGSPTARTCCCSGRPEWARRTWRSRSAARRSRRLLGPVHARDGAGRGAGQGAQRGALEDKLSTSPSPSCWSSTSSATCRSSERRAPVLPARQPPLRDAAHADHHQPLGSRMGHSVRRSRSWPPPSSTDCCTTATCSRSVATATGCGEAPRSTVIKPITGDQHPTP